MGETENVLIKTRKCKERQQRKVQSTTQHNTTQHFKMQLTLNDNVNPVLTLMIIT